MMKQYTTPSASCFALQPEDILTASFTSANDGLGDQVEYSELV